MRTLQRNGLGLLKREQMAKTTRWVTAAIRLIFLVAFSYILLYPVFYMISNALKTTADYIDPTVVWLPKNLTWDNFKAAFQAMHYPTALVNTISLEMVSAVIEVFTCAIFAYGLARFDFKWKKVFMFFLILTILVPDVMVVIPRIMNFSRLDIFGILGLIQRGSGVDLRPNIVDTPLTFYLPSVFGVGLKGGLFIFIYMQFFKGLPKELEEAAWIDGAGPLRTYFKIILPSSGVVILTVFIFSVVWHWNDYFLALMYTSDNRPLAVITREIQQYIFLEFGETNGINALVFGVPPAACLLFVTPPIILYLFLQKKFIQSIDRVGIVG